MNASSYTMAAIILIGVLALARQSLSSTPSDHPDAPTGLNIADLEAAINAPTVISLDKGVPVGTLRLNGQTYTIYTTTNNDGHSR